MIKRCLILVYLIGIFILGNTADVSAKVCFLPDGNCEAGKATYSPTNSITGCEYKDEQAANKGLGECQVVYQSGFCHYRRCKMSETECMKKAHEASHASLGTKKKCVVCKDGCWKLEESKYGPDTEHTCKEQGYKTKENCTADYVKFLPVNLVDKDGKQCGVCKDLKCSEMGGYIRKVKDCCPAGEEFEYAGKIDAEGYACGTCKAKTEPDPTPDPTPDDPNEGKTYYVIVNQNLTIQGTPTGSGTETILQFNGTITLPDVSNDDFFTKNEISFAAQPHIYAEISCDGGKTRVEPGDGYGLNRVLGVSSNIKQTADKRTMTFSYSETPWLKSSYDKCAITAKGVDKDKSVYGLKTGSFSNNLSSIPSDYAMTSDCKTITIDGSSRKICVKYSDDMHYCSYWGLKTESEANCRYGYTFIQDKEHPTDDYNNKCGTCVKNVAFSVNTLDCGGSVATCEYFYPCTSTVETGQQCYQCILSLYKNAIVIWIDNDGKIKYMKKDNGTYYSAPFSDEYIVLTTMNDYSNVADNLGTMEGWSPSSKFDNNIGQRRGFYELYIEQKHSDNTSQCYLSTDGSLTTWKLGNSGKSECKKEISGYTTSGNDNYTFGVGSGGKETLSSSDIKKMFPGKTINDSTTYIDISGTTGNGSIIMSKYVWYRVTDTKPGDNINIYPRCYRDVDLLKGFGGRCYFGWKNSSVGNYTNCKNLN